MVENASIIRRKEREEYAWFDLRAYHAIKSKRSWFTWLEIIDYKRTHIYDGTTYNSQT